MVDWLSLTRRQQVDMNGEDMKLDGVKLFVRDVSLPGHPVGEVRSINLCEGIMSVAYPRQGIHHNVPVDSIFIDFVGEEETRGDSSRGE